MNPFKHLAIILVLAIFAGGSIALFASWACPADQGRSLLDPYTAGVMRGLS
jgi:hypothetical protein